jgi:hypothetical protein
VIASSAGNSCGISNGKLLKNPHQKRGNTVANGELIIFNVVLAQYYYYELPAEEAI